LHQIQAKFRDLHAIQANAELWIKSSKKRFSGLESLARNYPKQIWSFARNSSIQIRALHQIQAN
jgi:hypothetical protein